MRETNKKINSWYELKEWLLINIFSNIPIRTSLSKKSKTGIILESSPQLQEQKYNINSYLNFNQYDSMISKFYEILEKRFEHCNLSSFYKNMKDLTIKNRKKTLAERLEELITGVITTAVYDETVNTINIVDEDTNSIKNIISHELLHMATTKRTEKVMFCGFYQFYKEKNIGIGYALNEGYTEYLNNKYFYKDEEECYHNEQLIAQGIERIIGQKQMEKLYFAADLKSLVDELSKYASIDNVMELLKKFDALQQKKSSEEDKEDDYRNLRELVSKIYLEKQKQLLEQGKITEEDYKSRKIAHVDVYINEKVSFPEDAVLIKEDCILKVYDSEHSVAIVTDMQNYSKKYGQSIEDDTIDELIIGDYSYKDSIIEKTTRKRG